MGGRTHHFSIPSSFSFPFGHKLSVIFSLISSLTSPLAKNSLYVAQIFVSLSNAAFHSSIPGLRLRIGKEDETSTMEKEEFLLSAAETTASFSIGLKEHVE